MKLLPWRLLRHPKGNNSENVNGSYILVSHKYLQGERKVYHEKDHSSFVPCCYGYRGRICCIDCLRRQLGFLCCQLDRYFRNGIHRSGSAAAKPDGYPNTSMTLVVGFGAGGDTDLNNRLMAQYVEPSFGQSIAVTNMAGSNGSVAMTQYQSTPTDGYTIIGANTSAVVNNFASGTCQYSYKDYEVIAVFGRGAGEMLFANKQSGITSMEDLLEKSKANPGTIKMGMSSGGNTHVYALLLQQAGFDCNIVDGGDGSDRIAALVGGHVDVCFVPYLTAKEYIENGDVTPLCTIGDRCSALPDTPSINEGGYVKNNFNGCYIWMAPKGTDAGIVSYLASLCEDVVNNNAKYDEDQRAINFNDPFIVTGQDALDFLEELQQTAIENVGVLG